MTVTCVGGSKRVRVWRIGETPSGERIRKYVV
jgi:hypothetical protein